MLDLAILGLLYKSTLNTETINNGDIQLSPIKVNEDYCKKWNEHMTDFLVLTKNGELISNSLYRLGGLGKKPDGKNYFMILKYIEDFYSADIMKMSKSKDPRHLSGCWCILDKDGNEKVVFKHFETPYLVRESCIYTMDRKYYNIETGEFYCEATSKMESSEFLFLHNPYDKDTLKKGVMKINKKDGTWTVFS